MNVYGPAEQLTVALIAAAGAFLVAWVAGGFSLLGLIISKEQQVSGFRQVWIDRLREDIAAFVAHAHQIQSLSVDPESGTYAQFWESTRADYVELNQASMRIKLRLNPEEEESKQILKEMEKMEALFSQLGAPTSVGEIHKIVNSLEQKAPLLLKNEWKRVKKGEPIYRRAKWLAGFIFLGAPVIVGFVLWKLH